MHIRQASESDIGWLIDYILGGFNQSGYVPDRSRVDNAIRMCLNHGVAWIVEHRANPVAILGAVMQPIFWAERNELTVLALRSTYPGAGLVLLRRLKRFFEERHDLKHLVINFDPANADPRLERLMQRWGARRLRSYLIQK